MGHHSLLSLAEVVVALIICATLLVIVEPYQAFGSSQLGSFGLTGSTVTDAPPAGICAAAVAIHGYECQEFNDGMTWVLNSPDESLAFILADSGFDVWIANTRGTHFSRQHVTLDPTNPKFWSWKWDDLVSQELPTIIDFVLTQTGQEEIHYVGHSVGSLIGLASFSEGKLIDEVKSAALLSPIAYLCPQTHT